MIGVSVPDRCRDCKDQKDVRGELFRFHFYEETSLQIKDRRSGLNFKKVIKSLQGRLQWVTAAQQASGYLYILKSDVKRSSANVYVDPHKVISY